MQTTTTTVLAFETSCDETGVAVVRKEEERVDVVAQALASQIDIHAATGGVVPEVAAREHTTVLPLLLQQLLADSKITPDVLDAISVTVGPGLQPALAVGVNAARTLSFAWGKPLVSVHHLEGHLYSALLLNTQEISTEELFPALALIVSGGHTMLVLMEGHLQYKVIGSTRDDAAGEAFDKVARLLGLGYPGGPALSALAKQGSDTEYSFTRPMLKSPDYDFSFSGLKTEILYTWRDLSEATREEKKADIAASFERAVVDVLVGKTIRAIAEFAPKVVLLAGGVAANEPLRESMRQAALSQEVPLNVVPKNLCGDNAVMIGQAATYAYEAGRRSDWRTIDALARIPLESFSSTPA